MITITSIKPSLTRRLTDLDPNFNAFKKQKYQQKKLLIDVLHSKNLTKTFLEFSKESSSSQISKQTLNQDINNSLYFINQVVGLLDPKSQAEEIHFRYSHDLNKLFYSLKTIRRCFTYLHQFKINKAVMVFGCLLLTRMKSQVNEMEESFLKKENKYRYFRFKEFCQSYWYTSILRQLRRIRDLCTSMENAIRLSYRFVCFVKQYNLDKILKSGVSEEEFERIMGSQLRGLIEEKILQTSQQVRTNHS